MQLRGFMRPVLHGSIGFKNGDVEYEIAFAVQATNAAAPVRGGKKSSVDATW
jgi:hypothetical protein